MWWSKLGLCRSKTGSRGLICGYRPGMIGRRDRQARLSAVGFHNSATGFELGSLPSRFSGWEVHLRRSTPSSARKVIGKARRCTTTWDRCRRWSGHSRGSEMEEALQAGGSAGVVSRRDRMHRRDAQERCTVDVSEGRPDELHRLILPCHRSTKESEPVGDVREPSIKTACVGAL